MCGHLLQQQQETHTEGESPPLSVGSLGFVRMQRQSSKLAADPTLGGDLGEPRLPHGSYHIQGDLSAMVLQAHSFSSRDIHWALGLYRQ